MEILATFSILVNFILIILLAIVVAFAWRYYRQSSQVDILVNNRVKEWQQYEMPSLIEQRTQIVRRESASQMEQWRASELDLARKQQYDMAHTELLSKFEQWKLDYEELIRKDAAQRSQSVIVGKVTEHFTPYLPGFAYNPKDARFIGTPIDFVVFDGLSDGEVKKVVFVEVKTGKSALSSRERRVRDAIEAGLTEWLEIRPSLADEAPILETSQVSASVAK